MPRSVLVVLGLVLILVTPFLMLGSIIGPVASVIVGLLCLFRADTKTAPPKLSIPQSIVVIAVVGAVVAGVTGLVAYLIPGG